MTDLFKLALVFALIVLLLRRKLKVGYVMLIASAALALLYLMPPEAALRTTAAAASDPVTLELAVALILIRMFEMILREKETLKVMMGAFRRIFGNLRAVIVSMPLLIGMLPSVGGAYFSAPMVAEATRGLDMSGEEKAFVNYWFRHPWEFVLPLYPGLLLASALTGIELRDLIIANAPFAALMIVLGFALSMRQARGRRGTGISEGDSILSFLPVALVLLLVIALGFRLFIALGVVVAGLLAFHRYGWKQLAAVLRHGLNLDVVVLIFGVMLFKHTMQSAGAVGGISSFFNEAGVPLIPALILLPLLTGVLTGLTIGFVGATFPLLVSLPGGDALAAVALAFAAGFAGVLLSPVHVCLILTREYFHAAMGGLYRWLALPSALLVAAGLAEYLLLR
jgi:integral membrane protein (TIGR00529 family)